MIISVASGKGGTGKTLVATSLAFSLKERETVQLLDCDVEEPNDHILLRPEIAGSEPVNMLVPVVDKTKCTSCGKCAVVCYYQAIAVIANQVLTFPALCHSCGACSYLCPEKAITEEPRPTGVIEWGNADGIDFVQGILAVGEAMATPVIRQVKQYTAPNGVIIRDVPPGTSCPVVEAIKSSDFCILVTEPTPFGLNDLSLAVETVRELGILCGIVLNRAGEGDGAVEKFCRRENLPVLLTIPLDMNIARIYSQGITLAQEIPEWQESFIGLYEQIKEMVGARNHCLKR